MQNIWFARKLQEINNGDLDNLADAVAVVVPLEKAAIFLLTLICIENKIEGIKVKELVHNLPQETAAFAEYGNKIELGMYALFAHL